jgi:hypothetical protein
MLRLALETPAMSSESLRKQRARLGGLATAARYDAREQTAPARAAFLRRFVDQVDPDRALPRDERERRTEAAMRLHFARLSFLSARARSKEGSSTATNDRRPRHASS